MPSVLSWRSPRLANAAGVAALCRGPSARRSLPYSSPPTSKPVKLVVSDVDGTLLNSQQQLTPAVERAIQQSAQLGVPVVVATGKARGPWIHDVLPRLGHELPGVFLQGLLVSDPGGTPLYCRSLEVEVVQECTHLAKGLGLTLTAYCNDRILCETTDQHTDRLIFYKEPTPESVGPLDLVVQDIQVQKLIFMGPHERILDVRGFIEVALSGRASLTTALPGMLEVLPLGASKGAGVQWLLNHLGMDPLSVMAMGDGENDIEMLRLAGVAVAMGNASSRLKSEADIVVRTNDEDGAAQALHEVVVAPTLA